MTDPPDRGATGLRLTSPFASTRAAALWTAALGLLVFANSLANGFAYDDVHLIPENPELQSLRTLPGLLVSPYWPGEFGHELGLWRPLTVASWGLMWAAWGDAPFGYHLVNVLAHGAATALLVLVAARVADRSVAFLAGALFAVHPVHVEAVANVVGFSEVVAGVFYLGACLLHLRAPPERYGAARLAGVGLLYALAFVTKESSVTLPAALGLLDAARERLAPRDLPGYLRRRWPVYALLAGLAAAILVARVVVLGSIASPLGPLGAHLLEGDVPRIWTLGQIWAHYVRLMVFPLDLSSDYSPDVIPVALSWNALGLAGLALALGTLGVALWGWRQGPVGPGRPGPRLLGVGIVWFVVTVLPVSNVVFLSGVLLAERTLYLPSVGVTVAGGWLLVELWRRRRRVGKATAVTVLLLMGLRTVVRNPTWRDSDTAFLTMIAQYPQSGRSQWMLADLLYQQGRVDEALRTYRVAVGLLGGHYPLLIEIARNLMDAGREDQARALLESQWRDRPTLSQAPTLLAILHYGEGRYREAVRWGRRAAAAGSAADPVLAHVLAGSLTHQGAYQEAIRWRERAIDAGEGEHWQQWAWLASLRLAVGDSALARAARDSALARTGSEAEREAVGASFRPPGRTDPPLQDPSDLQDARLEGG